MWCKSNYVLELQPERLFFERLPSIFKKLVSVSVTFAPMTWAGKKNELVLDKVLYIHYLLHFRKNKENKLQALINLDSKVNAMTPAYASKLGLKVHHTNV